MRRSEAARADDVVARGDMLGLGAIVGAGAADVIYMDPPFGISKRFAARAEDPGGPRSRARGPVAYDDLWPSLEAYLAWLTARVVALRELLADHGTLWLHLDARAVHDAKVACDRVFGRARFLGEVIWAPGNGSKARRGPGLAHQTLLLYARGRDPVWNHSDPALREPYADTSQAMHFKQVDADGRRYRDRTVGGKTYRYYADVGRAIGTVWTDCPAMVANTPLRRETTGYPTQKPLKLLDRIVRASSRPGGLVVDPCFGSGTTLVAAAAAGRRFAGCDIGERAVRTARARLDEAHVSYIYRELTDAAEAS